MGRLTSILQSQLQTPQYLFKNLMWRLPRSVCEQEIVFVLGAPRSGTTLLQRLIASHSAFFSIQAETGLFSWQNIFARDHFGLSHDENRMLFKGSKDIIDFFDQAVTLLSTRHAGKRFIEKTPQHVLHLSFLLKHFPTARFVHIVRDGRDCYCSAKSHPDIPQRHSVEKFARYWRDCVQSGLNHRNEPRLITIRYEDLASQAEAPLNTVMQHLGVELESAQLDATQYGSDSRAALQEFKRLSSAITPSTVGRWQEEMSSSEKDAFSKIAGTQLRAFGYIS
ncbi:MAG: sulfotransferase [Gammaproteobacteria bacterium]|nr:sulfotransferase [Gammaproteobacteria bacterium]